MHPHNSVRASCRKLFITMAALSLGIVPEMTKEGEERCKMGHTGM